MNITNAELRVILDSRGKETLAARLFDNNGNSAEAMAPSGTSRSEYEAVPFAGNSAEKSVEEFKQYKSKLVGMEPEQKGIDSMLHEIDGTENFSKIGGNAATAISIAAAKLAAAEANLELYQYIYENFTKKLGIKKKIPGLLGNVIGGGVHSHNKMSIQEILLATSSGSVMENAKKNIVIHSAIGAYLQSKDLATGLNIENAWNTKLDDSSALALASDQASSNGTNIGIDCAASEFYKNGNYVFDNGKRILDRQEYISFLLDLAQRNKIAYVEDPMDSNDAEGFAEITKALKDQALIVGDDIYATNKKRLDNGISKGATTAILIKVNQVGTLSDVLETVELAHSHGIKTVVSHRSGETIDAFMSHLAVALGSEYIKCGIVGGERIAKINELARIESIERQL
ncbi:MAG: enolase C-terminal domain-like protein [Candidatus Micrarchaeaceae archaeon]